MSHRLGSGGSRWRKSLSYALPMAVQAIGSLAGFAIVIVVSQRFGIEAQGRYGLMKSWCDAIAVTLMFGLPQSLLHLSYHGEVPIAQLRGYAERYSTRLAIVAAVLAIAAAYCPWPWLAWVVLAAPAMVLHGLLRSLLLRASGAMTYAWVTVSPALLLLTAVLVLAGWDVDAWGPALLASALGCALLTLAAVRHAGIGSVRAAPSLDMSALNRHAFAQNACAAAQTALLLSLVAALAQTTTDVGETSFALVFAQLFALAASFMAPVVYDAVARAIGTPLAHKAVGVAMTRICFVVPALVMLAIATVPAVVARLFAASYASSTLACQVMAVAGVLMLVNRLGATLLQALGDFPELTRQAIARLSLNLLLATFGIAAPHLPTALAVGLALGVTELGLGMRLIVVLRRWMARDSLSALAATQAKA